MSQTEQADWLKKILEPDIVVNLDKTVATPFDLFQLREQLDVVKPELLARHYYQLGKTALEKSAYDEAIEHFDNALEQLEKQPETLERVQFELELRIARGTIVMTLGSYADKNLEKTYFRAWELWRQIEKSKILEIGAANTSQLFSTLRGLCQFYLVRADLHKARQLGEKLLQLAQKEDEQVLLAQAHAGLGTILYYRGELSSAKEQLELGIACYKPDQHRDYVSRFGQDIGVTNLSILSWVLCYLGYPDQALKKSKEAVEQAENLAHPFSIAFAKFFATFLYWFRQDEQTTKEAAEELIALSREHGFSYWLALGNIFHGWALAKQGRREKGIKQLEQGLDARLNKGENLGEPHVLAMLAEAYERADRPEEGLSKLAEALDVVNEREERASQAQLHRLKGELLLKVSADNAPKAEACFHQSIEVARRQQAKSLELRATISLSRLWQIQGKKTEALQMLSEIYGWFTEGFDTPDLKEAKALLEELS